MKKIRQDWILTKLNMQNRLSEKPDRTFLFFNKFKSTKYIKYDTAKIMQMKYISKFLTHRFFILKQSHYLCKL
jgi:hypothetical protein